MGVLAKRNSITAQQARDLMETSEPVLLDVRTPSEYHESHIRGARLIPVDELDRRASSELPDRNALILVYCRSGARAANAVKLLVHMGYKNVFSFGGILDWPYETVKEQGVPA